MVDRVLGLTNAHKLTSTRAKHKPVQIVVSAPVVLLGNSSETCTERECVCVRERERVCVCVCERERERECVCVCVPPSPPLSLPLPSSPPPLHTYLVGSLVAVVVELAVDPDGLPTFGHSKCIAVGSRGPHA